MYHWSCAAIGVAIALSWVPPGRAEEWTAPESEKSRVNPLTSSPQELKKAGVMYTGMCVMCHGPKGKGDGPVSGLHETRTSERPRDLSDPALQKRMTDGEIFWKISTGLKRGDTVIMPAYEQTVPSEEDRWRLVLFVRSLSAAAR